MKPKKRLKFAITFLIFIVIIVNTMAVFHAYKFTHFVEEKQNSSSTVSNKLNILDKVKTILFGINNSKPKYSGPIPEGYHSKTLVSNVDLNIWENNIPNSKGIILLFHGYSAEKSSLMENAKFFNDLGYSTILTDFMGHGASEGQQTTIGYFEAENVKTVYDYAKTKNDTILLYGFSMGSVAVMKAVADLKLKPNKIILECPFGSMQKTVEKRFENMNIPSFPMANLLTFWGGTINGFWAFDHNPEDYAKSITQPTLLMYGKKDKNVTLQEIETIFGNLNSSIKEKYLFEKAGHENYLINYSKTWKETVAQFISQ